jgi:hypothetical protein
MKLGYGYGVAFPSRSVAGGQATFGGVPVGATGGAGTIYEGFSLAGGEEFNSLDVYSPTNPNGKHIASHRRRGRRAINSGANDYYWSPEHTGYQDANRGVPIGSSVNDLFSCSASVLALSTRLATPTEKSLAWTTTASTGPQRPQSSSALHSAGFQAVKWPFVISARMKVPTGAQLPGGGWPAFWMENVLPTWTNTGEFDFEWIDNGNLYCNFIDPSATDGISNTVVDTSDGDWHIFSMKCTASTLTFYKDGVLIQTAQKRPDASVTGPMFWWFRIGVDLTPSIYKGMNYQTSAWTGVTATMEIDWVQIWIEPLKATLIVAMVPW